MTDGSSPNGQGDEGLQVWEGALSTPDRLPGTGLQPPKPGPQAPERKSVTAPTVPSSTTHAASLSIHMTCLRNSDWDSVRGYGKVKSSPSKASTVETMAARGA